MNLLAYDTETSIGKTIHGPTFRDSNNDIYTQIWATGENDCKVVHNPEGFKRTLCQEIDLSNADYFIGHNLSFDLCYVWHNQTIRDFILRGGKLWCTQAVEYILTGQQHSFSSLAELQLKHLGEVEKPSRISYLYKKGIGADKIVQASRRCPRLFRLYNKYCKSDGVTPIKIFKKQYEIARQSGMLAIVELYNDYLASVINMTCTGIHIDIKQCEKTLRDFNGKHLQLLQEAQDILKKYWTDPRLPEFKINSNDHKSAVLFGGFVKVDVREHVGYFKPKPIYAPVPATYLGKRPKRRIIGYEDPVKKYRKAELRIRVDGFGVPARLSRESKKPGVYVTDVNTMRKIELGTKNVELKRYCELQKQAMMYKKAASTYCQAFLDRSVNGVLYPNFNNTVTPTGRLTASDPNTQNLPSKAETAAAIEGLLVAPPGFVCLSADYSQLEKWVQAWVSGDKALTSALLAGKCLHCVALAWKEGMQYEEVYDLAVVQEIPEWVSKRKNIKPVSFQMDYGAMPPKVAESTGLPLEMVEDLYELDKKLYPQKHYFFGEYLQEQIKASAGVSLNFNIPAMRKKGKEGSKFLGKAELLPIFDKEGNIVYNNDYIRKVGYWQSDYGKKYHFMETGNWGKAGIRRSFSFTQPKNFPNQGGGSDVQGATSAEMLKVLIEKSDRIKLVLEIHDSKRFYVREDVLPQAVKWIRDVMEDVPKIFKRRFGVEVPFKFPVSFEWGKHNFGNMEKYDE